MKRGFHQKIGGAGKRLLPLICLGLGWLLLAGCSDRTQEMEERVTQLQRELERVQAQLSAATQNAPSPAAAPSGATASAATLSSEALQETFQAADAEMRKELDANLSGYHVKTSLVQTTPAADPYPYKSQINLVVVSDAGKEIALSEIPVKADARGKWVFPTSSEVNQQIAAHENADANGANATADNSNARPAAEPEAASRAMMPVNDTVTVRWGDEGNGGTVNRSQANGVRPSAGAGNRPAPPLANRPVVPQPAERAADPAPAPSRGPVMPVSRDVTVKF